MSPSSRRRNALITLIAFFTIAPIPTYLLIYNFYGVYSQVLPSAVAATVAASVGLALSFVGRWFASGWREVSLAYVAIVLNLLQIGFFPFAIWFANNWIG